MKTIQTGLAAITLVGIAALLLHYRADRFATDERHARTETRELEREAWDADQRSRALEQQIESVRAAAVSDAAEAARIAATPADLRVDAFRARRQFATFAAQHGIPLPELDRLSSVIADALDTSGVTAAIAAISAEYRGINFQDNPEKLKERNARLGAAEAAARADQEAKMRSILGDDNFAAYQAYLPIVDMNDRILNFVEGPLRASGNPLTQDQSDRLAAALISTTGDPKFKYYDGTLTVPAQIGSSVNAKYASFVQRLDGGALAESAAFLSPAQFAFLERLVRTNRIVGELVESDRAAAAAAK